MALSQREIHDSVEQATSVIVEPFYGIDSKIEAVKSVSKIDTPEALSVLKRALEMISYPLDARNDSVEAWFKSRERPRGGKLSGSAAVALAKHPSRYGIEHLLHILSSDQCDAWLKDCAAFGLTGILTAEVLEALSMALRDKHPGVRLAAVRSLDESLSNLSVNDREPVLLELFKLACHNYFIEEPAGADLSAELARQTVRIYRTPQLDLTLVSCVSEMEHDDAAKIGAEIIGESLSPEGAVGLAYLLKADNRSPEEYAVIGKLLKSCPVAQVREIARQVLESKNYVNSLLGLVSSEVRWAAKERQTAARLILS